MERHHSVSVMIEVIIRAHRHSDLLFFLLSFSNSLVVVLENV